MLSLLHQGKQYLFDFYFSPSIFCRESLNIWRLLVQISPITVNIRPFRRFYTYIYLYLRSTVLHWHCTAFINVDRSDQALVSYKAKLRRYQSSNYTNLICTDLLNWFYSMTLLSMYLMCTGIIYQPFVTSQDK